MPEIPNLDIDPVKRRMLTSVNLIELNITEDAVQAILASDGLKKEVRNNGNRVYISPDGLSINERNFGNYPGPTAAEQGWISYFHIGAPLVEERADIIQPPPDVLSSRLYENRSSRRSRSFTDSVQFTISNTLSWSLEGTAQLTLEGSATGELAAQLQVSMAQRNAEMISYTISDMASGTSSATASNTAIIHAHPDNTGFQNETLASATDSVTVEETESTTFSETITNTETETGTGTATGSATALASLLLGLTGSVGGSVTTSWTSTSEVSGDIPAASAVQTMATQRRQVKQYTYELPITFGGFVALHYPQPVSVERGSPQDPATNTATVIARDISALGLADVSTPSGIAYRPKGVAELVSTLGVEHIVFDEEEIPDSGQTFSYPRKHYLETTDHDNDSGW
ncbi:hypothetical protein [Segniliparus rugosus]|uniref:Uncharacterized protein n=1 Tax=Segniliparus rugosus (strain ATCC BAA-974 / DSM 45345 / CCUG 50838 / CIP 108380 / JCM 13579 / CDC 945) TaxID=679197 RepID=E5XSH1_SEGRC|nr:hypothetical protein [Segniliparus rugosus]EFV12707.1 hypothetical protein HMPREF9336_02443 [Segniliparus rugosus ATCC BAA-974]